MPGNGLRPKIAFQGEVTANAGIVLAFEREVGMPVIVPPN